MPVLPHWYISAAMKLAQWLKANKVSARKFSEMIGVGQVAGHRYKHGQRIPEPQVMLRIMQVTKGAVTANDFYPSVPAPRRGRIRKTA